jgi:hypothetical protein
MLTWSKLLLFYGANVVVWLGIALLYVRFFHDSDAVILGNAQKEASSDGGVDNG